jgi:hypothetical protein
MSGLQPNAEDKRKKKAPKYESDTQDSRRNSRSIETITILKKDDSMKKSNSFLRKEVQFTATEEESDVKFEFTFDVKAILEAFDKNLQ